MSSSEENEKKLPEKAMKEYWESIEKINNNFQNAIKEVQAWQKETFGDKLTLKGILLKLHEEFEEQQEVQEAVQEKLKEDSNFDITASDNKELYQHWYEELADFIMVALEFELIGSKFGKFLVSRMQMPPSVIEKLTDAMLRKLEVNKKRKEWNMDDDGVSKHIEKADGLSSTSEGNTGIQEADKD